MIRRTRHRLRMKFEKWQALGNDYLIVEAAALPWELTAGAHQADLRPALRGRLGRHPAAGPESRTRRYVAELRIFNPDGSEAELSGNGAREAVLYLRRSGWTDADEFTILTKAGPITPTIRSERDCTLDDGQGEHDLRRLPVGRRGRPRASCEAGGRTWAFQHVSIGNPQCAIEVDERSSRTSTWPRSARRSRTASSSRTAPTSASSGAEWRPRSGPGSSSAGWGRPSPPGPAPAAPRSRPSWPARRAR